MAAPTPGELHLAMTESVGGPAGKAWRERTLTRAKEIESLASWILHNHSPANCEDVVHAISQHLKAAREAAEARPFVPTLGNSLNQRAMGNLGAAEAHLLNIAPARHVVGQLPSLLNHVQRHLVPGDPRRQELERITQQVAKVGPRRRSGQDPGAQSPPDERDTTVEEERGTIVTAVRGASSAALREQLRVSSFRAVLVATTIVMTLLGAGIGLIGVINPTGIPLCFAPQRNEQTVIVCPTGETALPPTSPQQGASVRDVDDAVRAAVNQYDLLLVELIGLTAAAVAAAGAIRHIRGSSEPYGLPVALAALKLPTGAVTAFLGLLLMRGQFVPGLAALDTSAQIFAWAIVFGYAQQLFTRFVDQQAHTVLDKVRGADKKTEPKQS